MRVYALVAGFLRLVTRIFFRTVEVVGTEHVPPRGAVILCSGQFIEPKHLPPLVAAPTVETTKPTLSLTPGTTVEEAENRLILMTLEHTRDNKTRAAEILGISLKTLHNKLNKLRGRGPARQEEAVSNH